MVNQKPNSKTNSQSGKLSKDKSTNSSMQSSQLMKLFEYQLKDIYWAEKALTKAIPKMIKKATSQELTDALTSHLAETKNQVTRLEQVFETIGKKATAKKCDAMEGLTKEAEEIMESTEEGAMRDAGIILTVQKVEHYEIATYGTLCAFARTLGQNDIEALLQQTLDEERECDVLLSEIAQLINLEAADEDESEEGTGSKVATKSKRK
jgi:ferritin-like metal-binding protein YciE